MHTNFSIFWCWFCLQKEQSILEQKIYIIKVFFILENHIKTAVISNKNLWTYLCSHYLDASIWPMLVVPRVASLPLFIIAISQIWKSNEIALLNYLKIKFHFLKFDWIPKRFFQFCTPIKVPLWLNNVFTILTFLDA